MRKNFGVKPYTYPQPVFIIATYGEDGTPDAMNAAWGGISDGNELSMCLSAGHKTVKNILKRKAFTVSMADAVDAPLIEELAVAVECRLKSYDEETCRMVGEIVNVSVDESVLDEQGKVDVVKVQPITFDPFNNTYVKLGEVVGNAFKDGAALK